MPKHIVELILHALTNTEKDIKKSKIAILGTAYKADVDDPRGSPLRPIIQKLIRLGVKVIAYDPPCKETFGAEKSKSLKNAVEKADSIIIVTDHEEFRKLNLQKIKKLMNKKPIIIDGRRIIDPNEAQKLGFFYYGIGYGLHTRRFGKGF